MDPTTILYAVGLALEAMLIWPAVRHRRANARLQRAVRSYDEARRTRILAGEDPDAIPTAEQELTATGHAASVRSIERMPRPDPVGVPRLPRVETPPVAQTPSPPPAPSSADPFLARLAEQAKVEAAWQQRMRTRSKHKPPRLARPSATATAGPAPGRRYMMTYATGWGEVTEREIRFKRAYLKDGEVYVDAFCFLRGENRTFRADRMTELFDRDNSTRVWSPTTHFRSAAD